MLLALVAKTDFLQFLFIEDSRKTLCRESREHCPTDSLSEASSEYESDWEAEVD